jgi:hypothetical protein
LSSKKSCATIHTVIVRKGKSGKERLTPFIANVEYFKDDDIRQIFGNPLQTKKYGVSITTSENAEMNLFDVRKVDPLSFIGWAAAKIRCLHLINTWFKANNPFLKNVNSLLRVVDAIVMTDQFDGNPEANKAFFDDPGRRISLVEELRHTEAEMSKSLLRYYSRVENLFHKSITALCAEANGKIPDHALNASFEKSLERMKAVEALIENHKNKI